MTKKQLDEAIARTIWLRAMSDGSAVVAFYERELRCRKLEALVASAKEAS